MGATRNSRQGSSPRRIRIVRAVPERLTRTVTSLPDQSGTGATDQSDMPLVTTADACKFAVGELDTCLRPTGFVRSDEDSGLIELLVEIGQERHLDGPAVGQIAEQGVRAVPDESVGRRPPGVGCRGRPASPADPARCRRWAAD